MEMYRILNNIIKKTGLSNSSFRKTAIPGLQALTSQVDEYFFQNKKIAISGEFFPMSENFLKSNLVEREANVQPEMTPETEILICGKYPDWMLVEEARLYGVTIIFVDKAGELFSKMASGLLKNNSVLSYEEPLGV